MNREEKLKKIKELKGKYKDFTEKQDKNNNDLVYFNVGEVTVPEGLTSSSIILRHADDKLYLVYRILLGKNAEYKAKRDKLRASIMSEKKEAKVALRAAINRNDSDEVVRIMALLTELKQKLTKK